MQKNAWYYGNIWAKPEKKNKKNVLSIGKLIGTNLFL